MTVSVIVAYKARIRCNCGTAIRHAPQLLIFAVLMAILLSYPLYSQALTLLCMIHLSRLAGGLEGVLFRATGRQPPIMEDGN